MLRGGQTAAPVRELVTDTTKAVKEKLGLLLGGLPPNKMQLKHPTLNFMKDAISLAQYNVASGDMLELKFKSRGRR